MLVKIANQSPQVIYTITSSAGSGGSISPMGSLGVNAGGTQKFVVTPSAGYAINNVLVDGTAVALAIDNSYTFTNVTATHTIVANFTLGNISITNLTITYPANSNGQILVNFSSNQALTRSNVSVQVAVSQSGPWYILSGNYAFIQMAIIRILFHYRLTAFPLMC